ncbi:MAG: M15 family metallopeptidase [Clostridiales Family XIII bacterium]|nr:M15 family metallopeptidase [Clostridiales Family XIII bacterium]
MVIAIVALAVGVLSPAFSFADSDATDADMDAKDASVSVPGIDESGATGNDGYDEETGKYFPSTLYSSDIKVLVSAKILKKNVYKKNFSEYITAEEMNDVLLRLHRFLGGAEDAAPATVSDRQVFDGSGTIVNAVERGDAISSLAMAAMNAQPAEWATLREPLYEFMAKNAASSANGTVAPAVINITELEKDGGVASIPQTNPGIEREDMFSIVSRMLWQFEPDEMIKAAPVPEVPQVLNVQGEEFYKKDIYLYWVPVNNAAKYIVRIFGKEGEDVKRVTVSEPVLNITADGPAAFSAIFGDEDRDYKASFTVQAVSAHGLKSDQTEPVSFTALKYDSVRERYGSKYIHYKDGNEGKKHQTVVTLYVWREVDGEKVPATVQFSVNKAVANSVVQIFGEYFNGRERFPIQSIGGFAVRPKRSEHNYGTAIDINPNENFMVGPNGITAGTYWDPSKSQYSIAPDSELVRAFERHGWYWAGNGWGNTYDYMHFSYMAT